MKSLSVLLAGLFVLFSLRGAAQSVYTGGIFPTLDHSGTLSSKVDYSLYYFAAFPLVNLQQPDNQTHAFFNLFYLEQALHYKVNDKFSLTAAYVYQRENVVYPSYNNEHRFHLQAKYKQLFKKITLTHRLRFDGRFISNAYSTNTPFTHRLRYLIGAELPLSETSYLSFYEEVFFNTFRNASAIYGENWGYGAYGKKLTTNNRIELGVLYITWNTGIKSWFHQYYVQCTWINHLDFSKNKNS
jgi:hypothetical protein